MIKYLGSKRKLLGAILRVVGSVVPPGSHICDLFSGSARVGHALKGAGYRVQANDHNAYAHTLATCYVAADQDLLENEARRLLAELSLLRGRAGYFTETFCVQSRFFHPSNGERVDAIREAIAALGAAPELEAVLLVSLMEAADRVDSTTGVHMAYLKAWAPRALNPLQLRMPIIHPRPAAGPCHASMAEAAVAAAAFSGGLAYLDPPYNQHSYLGNYHVWESLVRWDRPEHYGIACKRVDCRTRKSGFNSRPGILPALEEALGALRCPNVVLSFNDEGYISRPVMEAMLEQRGCLQVIEINHPRYVGARIGIHNQQGERVGQVSHVRNTEFLYVLTQQPVELPADLLVAAPAMAREALPLPAAILDGA